MSTLFTPVARNEIVQSMSKILNFGGEYERLINSPEISKVLLASWGETFWRPGGWQYQ